jgi:hypothetical protein
MPDKGSWEVGVMKPVRLAVIGISLGFMLGSSSFARAQGMHHNDQTTSESLAQEVRDMTRQYLDVNNAANGHYFPVLGCVSGPDEGAMGVHYLNGDLLTDGQLDPDQPEALIYEFKNGKATLVAVEYIVLAKDWSPDPNHPKPPPALKGQLFTYTGSPNRFGLDAFYALHVWAWKDNPNGTYVDWNPQVSCDDVTANP